MKQKFLIIALLFCGLVNAQDKDSKLTAIEAEKKMQLENYEDALDDYLQLLTTDVKNELYNYNV